MPLSAASGHARLQHGPLVRGSLVVVDEPERPFPGRPLRVPDRVVRHLLGDDEPEPALAAALGAVPDVPWGDPGPLAAALGGGITLTYLREPATGSGRVLATEALRLVGLGAVLLDLTKLAALPDAEAVARLAVREARLSHAGLVAGPVSALADRPALLQLPARRPAPAPAGRRQGLGPGLDASRRRCSSRWPSSTHAERKQLWQFALAGTTAQRDSVQFTDQFRLRPEAVARAAASAQVQAKMSADGVITGDAPAGRCTRRERLGPRDRLARRVDPEVGWDDLVLPPSVLDRAARRSRCVRGTASRCSATGGCGPAAVAATGWRHCSPATPAPARPCRPR